jgi:hypothetical protein
MNETATFAARTCCYGAVWAAFFASARVPTRHTKVRLRKKSPQALYRQVGDLPHNYRPMTYMLKWRRSLTCERLFRNLKSVCAT